MRNVRKNGVRDGKLDLPFERHVEQRQWLPAEDDRGDVDVAVGGEGNTPRGALCPSLFRFFELTLRSESDVLWRPSVLEQSKKRLIFRGRLLPP
jgi:hypothetical protein